jgi:LmbE family N-acetylglucosaminyl deacetylase
MRILIFSPHPDDAEISMGGTIAKYVKLEHKVLTAIVTMPDKNRVIESRKSLRILGSDYQYLNINPYELSNNRMYIEMFDKVINVYSPDVIYTSWNNDAHQDHSIVASITMASARKNLCSLYMYSPVLPSGITTHLFRSQLFVDVTDFIELKKQSLLAHKSQYNKYGDGWINGVISLAAYTGARINVKYAEAFEVVKTIYKDGVPC